MTLIDNANGLSSLCSTFGKEHASAKTLKHLILQLNNTLTNPLISKFGKFKIATTKQ